MKDPCKKCIVKPCCTKSCEDRIIYEVRIESFKRFKSKIKNKIECLILNSPDIVVFSMLLVVLSAEILCLIILVIRIFRLS